MMPHRDGWSVLQSLKVILNFGHIPVVIVSIIETKALAFPWSFGLHRKAL